MFSRFLNTTKKTPLGRWGISPSKVEEMLSTSTLYDHSCDVVHHKEYCEVIRKETLNYCTKCFRMFNDYELEYKNEKFGYYEKSKCIFK